jgi:hypothetical protein
VPLTAFNTFLLICSSVSMVKAYAAIADGKKYFLRPVPGKVLRDGGLKFWMLVTIICGAMFVGVQVFEYIKLVGHGFTPAGFREGSTLAEIWFDGHYDSQIPSLLLGANVDREPHEELVMWLEGFDGDTTTYWVVEVHSASGLLWRMA